MNIGKLLYRDRETGHSTKDRVVRSIILLRYNGVCQRCRRIYKPRLAKYNPEKYFDVFHVDHIVAFSRGGRNHIDNYQLLCRDCNLKKGANIDEETTS